MAALREDQNDGKHRRWLIVLDEVVAYRTSDSKFVIGKMAWWCAGVLVNALKPQVMT